MSRYSLLVAALMVFALSGSASADIQITGVINNAGLTVAGYDHWDITATSFIVGELIGGFDITFTTSSMRQVNPAGNPTVFQDANGFFGFVGEAVPNDSQFNFLTSEVTIPAGTNGESSTQLWAAFVFPAGSPHPAQSITFAQLVVPVGTPWIYYDGWVSIANSGGKTYRVTNWPEPNSLALLGLGGIMCLRRCRA
ncbi:MAG: PEP-CTERM sorting domain-containing protein [Phycisphaeraceae bacterium]|nr:PEP-CTERM sorting domain-containing protein [Phycisphaeraceae bacterium]